MKKGFKFLVLTLALFFVNAKVVNANELYRIDITADIDNSGNAHITEVWDMNVDEGTEVYKPMGNMDNMDIQNFTVKDETGTKYTFVDWDIDASLSDKAYKNGFNYADGHI